MNSMHFPGGNVMMPSDWGNDVDRLVFGILGAPRDMQDLINRLGIGTMAAQRADQVEIGGGALNGVAIGTQDPATEVVAYRVRSLNRPLQEQDVLTLGWYTDVARPELDTWMTTVLSALGDISGQDAGEVSIHGGTIENTPIGRENPTSGAFTHLTATDIPEQPFDVVNKAYLETQLPKNGSLALQEQNEVEVTGGTLDGVSIGAKDAGAARFTQVTLLSNPESDEHAVSKGWVESLLMGKDSGTMAEQNSDAVALTGGTIDGTEIGLTVPKAAGFTQVNVSEGGTVSFLDSGDVRGVDGSISVDALDEVVVATGARHDQRRVNIRLNENVHLQEDSGKVLVGKVGSTRSETLQAVGGAYLDTLESSRVVIKPTSADSAVQIEGQALARGWKETLQLVKGNKWDTVLDLEKGSAFRVYLQADVRLLFENAHQKDEQNTLRTIRLFLIQDQVTPRAVYFPENVEWLLPMNPFEKVCLITLYTLDNGSSWYATPN